MKVIEFLEKANKTLFSYEIIPPLRGGSIKKIFNLHNFDLIDTIPQITHGGSMRYVIGRRNKHDINANVKKVLADEQHFKIDKIEIISKNSS